MTGGSPILGSLHLSKYVDQNVDQVSCSPNPSKNKKHTGWSWVISRVPMFHITQPWSVYGLLDGYYKVMSNSPKMGHLPTPVGARGILLRQKNAQPNQLPRT